MGYDGVMHFTDEQPFLDAIFDRYDDDRPRLIYADFLDDTGEPERAELIRVQLALTRLSENDPHRPLLCDRQAELLNRNRAAWTSQLAGLVLGIDFRRGIPDSASVDAATFLDRGEELFRRLRVRRLRLLDAAPVIAKLFLSPLLANLRELDLCNADLGNAGLTLLARSPFLKTLESLDLGFNGVTDAGIEPLARAGNLAELNSLALNDNNGISDDGLRAIAESPFFAGLTSLDVSGNDIGETGIAAVAASPAMRQLRGFRVNGNRIGDSGLTMLVQSPLFARHAEGLLETSGPRERDRLCRRGRPGGVPRAGDVRVARSDKQLPRRCGSGCPAALPTSRQIEGPSTRPQSAHRSRHRRGIRTFRHAFRSS